MDENLYRAVDYARNYINLREGESINILCTGKDLIKCCVCGEYSAIKPIKLKGVYSYVCDDCLLNLKDGLERRNIKWRK